MSIPRSQSVHTKLQKFNVSFAVLTGAAAQKWQTGEKKVPSFTFATVSTNSAGLNRALVQTIYADFYAENQLEILHSLLEFAFLDEDCQQKIAKDGGLPILTFLATSTPPLPPSQEEEYSDSEDSPRSVKIELQEVQRTAAAILVVTAQQVDTHKWMMSNKCIEAFLHLMKSDDLILQMHGAAGIASLAANEDKLLKARIAKSGVLEPLIHLLHSHTLGVLLRASWALGNLAGIEENQRAIAELDGIEPLVELLSCPIVEIGCQAIRALSNLAVNPNLKPLLVEDNIMDGLIKLGRFSHYPIPRFMGQTLCSLLTLPEARKQFIEKGGVVLLLSLANSPSGEVQVCAAKAINWILSSGAHLQNPSVKDTLSQALNLLHVSENLAVRKQADIGLPALNENRVVTGLKEEDEMQRALADSLVVNALESSNWSVAYPDLASQPLDCIDLSSLAPEPGSPRKAIGGLLSGESAAPEAPTMKPKRRRGHRKVTSEGKVIYKGHPSYDLMRNIQLGIRYCVGIFSAKPPKTLTKEDFALKVSKFFPSQGTNETPAHQFSDFTFKDYAPMVWRELRQKFAIETGDYMLAVTGNDALRELGATGNSGSVFYLSQDGRFVIKTISTDESKFLENILPEYYQHVRQNPSTLLTRFFGLHKIKPHLGRNIRLCCMGNIFMTELYIHQRFDLKGSLYKRQATEQQKQKPSCTLKDLDLDFQFKLDPEMRELFVKQIDQDTKFLKACGIMDYSLLVGVHYLDREDPGKPSLNRQVSEFAAARHPGGTELARTHSDYPMSPSAATAHPMLKKRLNSSMIDNRSERVTLIANYPIENISRESVFTRDFGGMFATNASTGEAMLLFVGIIDILQQFVLRKKFEHTYKSVANQEGHSVIPPHKYAARFKKFMESKFIS